MYSKLYAYLFVAQLSAHLFASSVLNRSANIETRFEQDWSIVERAMEEAAECRIYSILNAIEYLTEQFKQEQNPRYRNRLHQYICGLYVNSPALCTDSLARANMMLAFQNQLLYIAEKENEIWHDSKANSHA